MRSSPRNRSQQISSSGHGLTLVGMLSLDLPAIVSVIFVVGAIVPASLVLTLGYLPFGLFNAVFGRGNMDRLVFEGAEIPLLVIGAGTVLLLAAPTFYWRIQHFRRILLSTTTVTGQIRSLNFTPLEFSVDYVYWFQQRACGPARTSQPWSTTFSRRLRLSWNFIPAMSPVRPCKCRPGRPGPSPIQLLRKGPLHARTG